jgi:cytochrome c oxidase assembly protein subunit 15
MAWVVTVHMLLAVAILAISIYTYFLARVWRDRNLLVNRKAGLLKYLVIATIIITLVQITLGTTVREQIDAIASAMNYLNRSEWISKVGLNFVLHRDLAILVLILNVIAFLLIRSRYSLRSYQFKYILFVVTMIGAQIITGIVLSYLALPPVAQAAHILLATLMFGAQFYLMLLLGRNKMYSRK